MVKQLIEKFSIFPKRRVILAVMLMTAFLFSPVEAKISDSQTKEIKDALEITNFPEFFDYSDENIRKILNQAIRPKESKITYGILIQSAFSEMEFMDMILTQSYVGPARNYFNSVLERNVSLVEHWKGTGKEFYDVFKMGSSVSPARSLAMEIVPITQKTMEIFVAFHNLREVRIYKGLWRYFDIRRGGDHEDAWLLAKAEMGWAIGESFGGLYEMESRGNEVSERETQFISLWNSWGPHATPYGISEEYKEQLAEEMRGALASALEIQALVEKEESEKPSLLAQLIQQLEQMRKSTAEFIARVNPFQPESVAEKKEAKEEEKEDKKEEVGEEPEVIEVKPPSSEPEPTLEEIQDDLDDILEEVDIVAEEEVEKEIEPEAEPEVNEVKPPSIEPLSVDEEDDFCKYKGGAAARFRVLINEVAWMGTADSEDEEWLEFRNIWGIPVNLEGWQLLDKDGDIKVVFGEDVSIPANGFYLLKEIDGEIDDNNEALYLFDADCNLEDEVTAMPNWPGGDKFSKKPMERFDVWSWYTSSASSGTAGQDNTSPPAVLSHPAPKLVPEAPTYLKLLINEIYIESKDNVKDDFVELYNPNKEKVSLTGWYLQRRTSGAADFSTYASNSLFKGKEIQSQSYFLVANASSTFAATADILTTYPLTKNNTLVLKNPKRDIADMVGWGGEAQDYEMVPAQNPKKDKSIGRIGVDTDNNQEDFEVQDPTPGADNQGSGGSGGGGGGGGSGGGTGGGAAVSSVVINEIAWAGTKANSADEWIELYNNTTSTLDLTDWAIEKDSDPWIVISSSTIPAQGYYLLERTDDGTIADISADQFFTGSLNNNGHKLELKDSQGNLIDSVDFHSGWPAGEALPNYISMERINSASSSDAANWASNNRITKNGQDVDGDPINGTPKSENSVSKSSTQLSSGLTLTEDLTLTYLGSPYFVEGSIDVTGAKLTVEPGVKVQFKVAPPGWPQMESRLKVAGGELEAIGSENQKIVFTSFYEGSTTTQPAAGDWNGFYLEDSVSSLENVIIRYGGKLHKSSTGSFPPYSYGMVYLDGGELEIQDSLIEKSATLGLWIQSSAEADIDQVQFKDINEDSWADKKPTAIYIEEGNPIIENSTFENNQIGILVDSGNSPIIQDNNFDGNKTPIRIFDFSSAISGNTAQNNNYNGIYLVSLGSGNIAWPKTNLPYIADDLTLFSGSVLNIEKGVVVKFLDSAVFQVRGQLLANGKSSQQIVFTAYANGLNYILFSASSTGSVLDNLVVEKGGAYGGGIGTGTPSWERGAITAENTSLTIKNSVFDGNLVAGLDLIDSAATIQKTTFKNHDAWYRYGVMASKGIYVRSGSCPAMSQVTFENNLVDIDPESCE